MKLKYITEDGLLMLRSNKSVLYKEVIAGNKSLSDFIGSNDYIKESILEIDDIVLDTTLPRGKETMSDAENVQRVYGHMKDLSDSQASDERIWAYYCLAGQLEYMRYRWKCASADDMLNHYFFNYSTQRSLFRNGISRLWWIGRVTFDENREDPYELTKYICRDQDFIETICGRNIFNNFDVMRATVATIYDFDKQGVNISRELVRSVGKYVNLLAGTYIVDILDYDVVYDRVRKHISKFLGE